MDISFWHEKWKRDDIGFHVHEANPLLVNYFGALSLPKGSRVFVPLCGKTRDIHWLLANGYRVAGAELSKIAIDQLFADLGLIPDTSPAGALLHYHAEGIDIFVGDLFDLSGDMLGPVDAIYDRAAYVALTQEMRGRYAAHLIAISKKAAQLLISYEYNQRLVAGPPFSISAAEVRKAYGAAYALTCLASLAVAGGLKGRYPATEHVWILG